MSYPPLPAKSGGGAQNVEDWSATNVFLRLPSLIEFAAFIEHAALIEYWLPRLREKVK